MKIHDIILDCWYEWAIEKNIIFVYLNPPHYWIGYGVGINSFMSSKTIDFPCINKILKTMS